MRRITTKARELRSNPTEAEQVLWGCLRRRQVNGCRFRRQAPIGMYIGDVLCFEKKLVVELDGGQHLTNREYDLQRTAWLESQGFRVLRFWNSEVFNSLEAVKESISRALTRQTEAHPKSSSPGVEKG